ncbi:MAG: vWA domain-containing protein [Labilithrix sp.]
MRPILFPLFFVVIGCAGGGSSDGGDSSSPGPVMNLGSGPGDWSNPIMGDGELKGSSGGYETSGSSSVDDSAPYAGSSSSGGSSGTSGESSSGASGSTGAASSSGTGGASGSSSSSGGISSGTLPPSQNPGPGVLTAGTWDDNRNFSFFTKYRDSFLQDSPSGALSFAPADANAAAALFGDRTGAKNVLDVSLVIDTTGSMGDEISYLQREFTSLVSTIQTKYPQAQQRWSLVLYKDVQDSYVVRWYDFRADTAELKSKLMGASAGGGGDFPEAPDQAIDIANRLSWRRDENVARVMFWIADAPHHDTDAARMTASVKAARDRNIHVYPVASSGVDDFTEYTMRQTAQITGGRYIFLTDDSGVGGSHAEPTVPCYFVTKLDKAILRMVDVELTGSYREPAQDEILRTAGDPESGICQVSDGTVAIY